jgi:RimJ/RimL family protein N-acetyltransferase
MAASIDQEETMQPSRYSQVETLRDGTRLEIRAQRPEDQAALLEAFGRMSEQSRYTRFFAPKPGLSEKEIAHFMNVDFDNHVALVAVEDDAGRRRIVGAGRYIVTQPGTAELAFMVDEARQGKGIALVLIRHLAAIARATGLDGLHAEVLDANTPMLKVFEKSGLAMSTERRQGVVHVALRLH